MVFSMITRPGAFEFKEFPNSKGETIGEVVERAKRT